MKKKPSEKPLSIFDEGYEKANPVVERDAPQDSTDKGIQRAWKKYTEALRAVAKETHKHVYDIDRIRNVLNRRENDPTILPLVKNYRKKARKLFSVIAKGSDESITDEDMKVFEADNRLLYRDLDEMEDDEVTFDGLGKVDLKKMAK